MKVFFTLLLLTNIVFAVFQWLVPYEQLMPQARASAVAEKLKLLDEPDTSSEQQLEPQDDSPATASKRNAEITAPLCYTLGPFKEQKLAQQTASYYKQQNIQITTRSSIEKGYMGMMVYIDGHKNRKEAIATAEDLRAKGVRDYIIVNDQDKTNVLSLGVYALKKNADRLKTRVEKLGYEVQTEPRYRNQTIYWLDYSQVENENLSLLVEQLKSEQGISRISRQCS
jgi:cell division septation protein DedD